MIPFYAIPFVIITNYKKKVFTEKYKRFAVFSNDFIYNTSSQNLLQGVVESNPTIVFDLFVPKLIYLCFVFKAPYEVLRATEEETDVHNYYSLAKAKPTFSIYHLTSVPWNKNPM